MFLLSIVKNEIWELLNDSCKLFVVNIEGFNSLLGHKVNSVNVVFSLSWSQGTLFMFWIRSKNCVDSSILLI